MVKKNKKSTHIKERNRIDFSFLILFILFLLIGLSVRGYQIEPVYKPELLVADPADYYGYFQLSANKEGLDKNEEVEIQVDLVTSGQEFNTVATVLRYNGNDFELVGGECVDMVDGSTSDCDGDSIGAEEGTSLERVLFWQGETSAPFMQTDKDKAEKFLTVTLKAKKDDPLSTVDFSAEEGHLGIHFTDLAVEENSIDQTKANQSKIKVTFKEKTDSCGDGTCQSDEDVDSCYEDCCDKYTVKKGDLNKDCVVNTADWGIMHKNWSKL